MPIIDDFKPDLAKIDWAKITSGVATIVKAIAEATPSPIDDMVADFVATRVVDILRNGPTPMGATDEAAAALSSEIQAKGLRINKDFLKKIFDIAKALIPLLLL